MKRPSRAPEFVALFALGTALTYGACWLIDQAFGRAAPPFSGARLAEAIISSLIALAFYHQGTREIP